jgi:hypothetical protein
MKHADRQPAPLSSAGGGLCPAADAGPGADEPQEPAS